MDRSSVRHKGNSVTTLFLLDLPILTYTCCLPAFALETLVIIGSNIITIHLTRWSINHWVKADRQYQ